MEQGVDVKEKIFRAEGRAEIPPDSGMPLQLQLLRCGIDKSSGEVRPANGCFVRRLIKVERKHRFAAAIVAADDAIDGERIRDPKKAAGPGRQHLAAGEEEETGDRRRGTGEG